MTNTFTIDQQSYVLDQQNLAMVRGNTLSFGLQFEGLDQALDGAFLTCRKNFTDEGIAFEKTLGNGITLAESDNYIVRVAPEDTKNLEVGDYYYDLDIQVNDDVFTILRGVLSLLQDV